MNRVYLKLSLFAFVLICWSIGLSIFNEQINLEQNETELSLPLINSNQSYDLVLLGTSRARVLTRGKCKEVMDSLVGQNAYLNLSQGHGGGGSPSLVSLVHFFRKNNRANRVVYFISPWVFFAENTNEHHVFFKNEPFTLSAVVSILRSGVPLYALKRYLLNIFNPFLFLEPTFKPYDVFKRIEDSTSNDSKDIEASKKKIQGWVNSGEDKFLKYSQQLITMKRLSLENNADLQIVFPPTLVDSIPGSEHVKSFLKANGLDFIEFNDFRDSIYFSDYIHLNYNGVKKFVPLLMEDTEG